MLFIRIIGISHRLLFCPPSVCLTYITLIPVLDIFSEKLREILNYILTSELSGANRVFPFS